VSSDWHGVSWAGIVSGPLAWITSTELNYALGSWPCSDRQGAIAWTAMVLVLVALGGGALSWRALGRTRASPGSAPRKPRSEWLVAFTGISLALLFAAVIFLHGLAGLVLDGCER
jgi:hypothetical protein